MRQQVFGVLAAGLFGLAAAGNARLLATPAGSQVGRQTTAEDRPQRTFVGNDENQRRYRDGPLKRSEFKAKPPEDGPLTAMTFAEFRFTYKYRYNRTRRGVLVRATEVDVFSIFVPQKSWLKGEVRQKLLDHEQGHFDLMQVHALQARLEIRNKLRDYRAIAMSKDEAVRKLEAQINKTVTKAFDKNLDAQKEYDYQTKHGLRSEAQQLHTRQQKKQLKELQQKFAAE